MVESETTATALWLISLVNQSLEETKDLRGPSGRPKVQELLDQCGAYYANAF